jgi:hypothetical protein
VTGEDIVGSVEGLTNKLTGYVLDTQPQGSGLVPSLQRLQDNVMLTGLKTVVDVGTGMVAGAVDPGFVVRGVMRMGETSASGFEDITKGNVALGTSKIVGEAAQAVGIMGGGVLSARLLRVPGTYQAPSPKIGTTGTIPEPTVRPTVTETGFGGYKATWGNDPKAFAMFERSGSGVQVSDLFRGGQPKGSGGAMLADALREEGINQPSSIRFTNILEDQPTLAQLAEGVPIGETVLGKTLSNTAAKLGGKVTEWTTGVSRGKTWIEGKISYEQ